MQRAGCRQVPLVRSGQLQRRIKGAAVAAGNWAMAAPERRMVDMFIPVSHAVAAGNRLTAGSGRCRVIPNFIPDTVGLRRRLYRDQLPGEGYLLFVGSLTRQKGIHTLLSAYDGLTAAPPLVLVGYTLPGDPGNRSLRMLSYSRIGRTPP